jgi:hypothetical protein
MILALAAALMAAIHVAGAYLGLRDSPILREGGLSPFLRRCTESPMHVAGAVAYLRVLGGFSTERRLRAYGVYEAVKLATFLYLSYLTWRLLS